MKGTTGIEGTVRVVYVSNRVRVCKTTKLCVSDDFFEKRACVRVVMGVQERNRHRAEGVY